MSVAWILLCYVESDLDVLSMVVGDAEIREMVDYQQHVLNRKNVDQCLKELTIEAIYRR